MNCDKFMEHLDDFIYIQLNDLEMEAMQAHADSCEKCAAEMEKRRALIEELGHLDDEVKAPEGLLKGAMERIRRERNPKRKLGAWIGSGIAAALCVTMGAAALLGGTFSAPKSAETESYAGNGYHSYKTEAGDYIVMEEAASDLAFTAPMADAPAAEAPMAEPMPMPDMPAEDMAMEYTAAYAPADTRDIGTSKDTTQSVELQAQEYGLKIIREASIDLETEHYEEDIEKLKALVAEFGGFITSSTENGSEAYVDRYGYSNRWCSLTIRVPSGQLDAFIERFDEIGIVSFTAVNETDVTAQYNDTDRRLESYKKQYERVQSMMDMAQTVEELISIESELARLEMQIEDAQGSLNHWDSRVNMSTVRVTVNEVRRATPVTEDPTLWERMKESLSDNWYYFTEGAKDTLVNLYGSIPYIVTWVIVLGAGWLIARKVIRKVRAKKQARK